MTSAFEDWEEHPAQCACGWAGTLDDGVRDFETELITSIRCPDCDSKLTLVVNEATFAEIEELAARGGKKAQEHLIKRGKRD